MSYLGQKLSHGQYRAIDEDNKLFLMNFSAALKGAGKLALGVAAAEGLHMAITEATKHDSSRAAANWDLGFRGNVRQTLQPARYGENPAGFRGDEGMNKERVWAYKTMVYGIEKKSTNFGRWWAPIEGQRLWSELGIGQLGGTPRVDLYNPLLGNVVARADGQGRTYAYNAFGGSQTPYVAMGPGGQQALGSGFSLWAAAYLMKTIKEATAQKRKLVL